MGSKEERGEAEQAGWGRAGRLQALKGGSVRVLGRGQRWFDLTCWWGGRSGDLGIFDQRRAG